jgi:hypothetical protein
MNRTYSELAELETFEERYHYLRLRGEVGEPTFGSERWMNQEFYTSREWRHIRHHVIARDNGCDLGIDGREIFDTIIIHHINPMTPDDIIHGESWIVDPEFLISTSHRTHNAIHYGDAGLLQQPYVERRPGDTLLWGRGGN